MPGKGRRVASRQAQLGRRRKRQTRGPSGTPTAEPETRAAAPRPLAESVATEVREPAPPLTNVRAPTPPRPVAPLPQTRSARGRGDLGIAYRYVMPELRRIGIMAGVLLVVLVVLSFFL